MHTCRWSKACYRAESYDDVFDALQFTQYSAFIVKAKSYTMGEGAVSVMHYNTPRAIVSLVAKTYASAAATLRRINSLPVQNSTQL
jgi:hypothetical protein